MKKETRFIGQELSQVDVETRADGDGQESPVIKGYGSIFYDGTKKTEYRIGKDYVERIMPGAFDGALNQDIRGLFNHEPDNILGRTKAGTMRVDEDKKGILYEIDVADTDIGNRVVTSIKRKDVTGSSFSFILAQGGDKFYQEGKTIVREITKVEKLYDFGPVTFPAYKNTTAVVRAEDAEASIEAKEAWEAEQASKQEDKELIQKRTKVRAKLVELDLTD